MAQSVQVPVPRSIWDWLLDIGFKETLTQTDEKKIDTWREGTRRPTIDQISHVSKKLRVPFGYFFLKEPVDDVPPVYAHRTVEGKGIGKPSRDLIDVLDSAQELQEWARQDLIDEDSAKLSFVGSAAGSSSPLEIAENIRGRLRLAKDWPDSGARQVNSADVFSELRGAGQEAGIIILVSGIVGENTHRPLSSEEFRAFTLIDDYAPLIFINHDDSLRGRLFSLAHELAHVWLGKEELYNDNHDSRVTSKLETLCNAVAAELLLPRSLTDDVWERVRQGTESVKEAFDDLLRRFPVSLVTLSRRAFEKGAISQKTYETHAREARAQWEVARLNRKGSGKGDYYNTKQSRIDHRLLEHLVASVGEGRTSYTEALRLTGTSRRTFPKLLEKVGLQ